MKKKYQAVAKVERNGKQWEVIISMYIRTKERALELINEFKETYKNTDLKVIETYIY